ncbi:hypothetical protein [Salipaludibacillus daqingensis]|uniref:hypothetical protein n=1 Tax=Salipaludibacillus daqingensis TaxID=3041001 RepID=UPI0024737C3A|nr:hypothetical protein [Salipaludibacillus daqingensis]
MSTAIIIALIALKGVCFIVCWRAVSMSRKQEEIDQNSVEQILNAEISMEEAKHYENKMSQMIEKNHYLKVELQKLSNKTNRDGFSG